MSIWHRQFPSPTMDQLLDAIDPDQRAGIDAVRGWLNEHLPAKPTLVYYDASWRWCERYTPPCANEDDLHEVYIIPQPDHPRVAVCCRKRFFEDARTDDLPKIIQAGLNNGICIGRFAWIECQVDSSSDADAVTMLLGRLTHHDAEL